MLRTARGRICVLGLLLVGQAVLLPLYAQQPVNPDAGVYPRSGEFIEEPEHYRGERVVTSGIVTQVSPLVIAVQTTDGTQSLTITGTTVSPAVGDKVRVFGTLKSPQTIESHRAFVVPRGGLWYTWAISFLAGLWVLGRLLRHWTLDRSRGCFVRRERPLAARDVWTLMQAGGDDDA